MAGLEHFYNAVAAWLRLDTGAGGLVPILGDAPSDSRIFRALPSIPVAKYPALTFRQVTQTPAIPESDLEIGPLTVTVLDFTAWANPDNELKVIQVLDRLERLLKPADSERNAIDPTKMMSNANVHIEGYYFRARLSTIFLEDFNAWSGTISTEWRWRWKT